uniref:NADH dehydrogenase [ubiquinone] 1 alpha subcomplex subunit 5 n=1 Tax=Cacopsylla melanoneura TaxID=428564 RepID=A0A8D8ZSE6_9HEMI
MNVLKKSTGLTGLAVSSDPKYALTVLYNKILRVLVKMPEDALYKKYTKDIVDNRLKIVQEAKSIDEMETKINNGQIEEVIVQAENELLLARKMLVWKPWEPLLKKSPPHQWTWPPAKFTPQN